MQISPKIIIVIVNYNGSSDTIECLKSILSSDYTNIKIIVVNNMSSIVDCNNLAYFCREHSKIHFIEASINGGFAYGNNIGIKYGLKHYPDCKLYWLLNNDTKIFQSTINNLLDFVQTCPLSVGIMGNIMCFYDAPDIIQALGGKFNKFTCRSSHIGAYKKISEYVKKTRPDYVVGASMLVRKEFIDSVGLMDEDYFLYFEELDWIERGRILGWGFRIDENNIILHKEGGSTNSRKKMSNQISAIQLRSRILFMKRFHPLFIPFSLLAMFATILKSFLKGDFKLSYILTKTLLKTLIYEK